MVVPVTEGLPAGIESIVMTNGLVLIAFLLAADAANPPGDSLVKVDGILSTVYTIWTPSGP